MNQLEHFAPRSIDRTDGHDQRIDHHVAGRDAVVGGALDDFLGHVIADVDVFRNTGFVVRYRDHRGAVLLDQWQHPLEAFVLTGNRVHQRLALVYRKPGFERVDNRRVDR